MASHFFGPASVCTMKIYRLYSKRGRNWHRHWHWWHWHWHWHWHSPHKRRNSHHTFKLRFGFNLPLCAAYHVLRIGPYFMNFAYVYTLCHKEGHSFTGLYAKKCVRLCVCVCARARSRERVCPVYSHTPAVPLIGKFRSAFFREDFPRRVILVFEPW